MLNRRTIDILIADDREDGLIALEAVLGDEKNYRLVKARSGREALELVPEYDFAMLLLDVQMPEMDGVQTADAIRRVPGYEAVPILFVTAINKDEQHVYRGYEVGAVDYIFKPFDPIILKSKVAFFAELHRRKIMIMEQAQKLSEAEQRTRELQIQKIEIENQRRYHNLADAIPHMVVKANGDGEVDYLNQQWTAYTGLGLEAMGRGWFRALHPDDRERVVTEWRFAVAQGRAFEAEARLRRHDGVHRWHLVKSEPEMNAAGKIVAWLSTCTDIEDRKRFEEELVDARQAAEAANNAKTHFLANMSHEIRTPLNAVMGFSALLTDSDISLADKMKSVTIVQRNCQQLLRIVDELLDLSKVEAGELSVEKIETPVIELLQEVKTVMLAQAVKKGIALSMTLSSSVPAKIVTDFTRLRQILLNIIGNAIKFTNEGTVTVGTRFYTDMGGKSYMEFSVSDTGIGIEEGSLHKIFKPFSQADSTTTRLFGGTGLGLALSRRLARAMGGDVTLARSQPGVGSMFVVSIEAEVVPESSWYTKAREDFALEAAVIAQDMESDCLAGKRILLVEDAEDNQVLIQFFLNHTGAILEIAQNGEEGIDKALHNDYEAVLMDIQMPLVDGYQATSRLRAAGYDKPIIALTAHALQEQREKCMETGCNGHLTKPISRRLLIESLMRVTN
ncbi:MAG: response regulator [Bdellovibrionaceae bacterium]|nr:response regulator [Pseudobdellovibrionaceae bacterium]